MEQPEVEARNGGVVPGIAQVEKAQQLFVNEIEPEETVIFPAAAMHVKSEGWWISDRRHYMPGERR